MGGEAFKRRLIHNVVVAIVPQSNFVLLLKGFTGITNVCKARLKVKFKCISVTMYSLVITPFSHDFYKNGNKLI